MDTLLTVALTNLSSRQPSKIRKGLRQIEGLLAQICLSAPTPSSRHSSPQKRQSLALPPPSSNAKDARHSLADLDSDPAFHAFSKLQDSFQSNIATRLLETLNTILSTKSLPPSTASALLQQCLSVLLGLLLLHPPSRLLFQRQGNMNILLDLLDPRNTGADVLSQVMLVLVAALLGSPENARVFERSQGLATVVSIFKAQGKDVMVTQEVRFRVLEFLYFYLMPEGPVCGSSSASNSTSTSASDGRTPVKQTETVKSDGSGSTSDGSVTGVQEHVRSMEEKQALLGKHLANVGDLVEDLRTNAPFGLTVF